VRLVTIGRNEPCPCGSGLKAKRCCGTQAAAERLERSSEALGEALTLATHFPRLRPQGDELNRWAERVVGLEPCRALIDEGATLAGHDGLDRVVDEYAREAPDAWRSLCEDVGSEEDAASALVIGAVLAAVAEYEPPDHELLSLLEEDGGDEPWEALALLLEPGDLWSIVESFEADEAIAALDDTLDDDAYEERWNETLEAAAARLGDGWHDERLRALVARIQERLPFDGYPEASQVLEAACRAFDADTTVRRRLAAALLGDSLGRIRAAELQAALDTR
jgi:hypothetical protein